ncbi:hypothetical protein QFZ25_001953 [Bacillus atrophaeus]|nr:hypothetical protein [Bacillus atrophaeus]
MHINIDVTVKQEITGVPVTILKTANEVGRSLISEEKNKTSN